MMLLSRLGSIGRKRSTILVLTALAAAGALLARVIGGWPGMALLCGAHGAALVLIGRALVPAGGRRPGWTIVAGLVLLFLFNALYAFTFFYAYTLPLLRGAAPWLFGTAACLLLLLLLLLPRPVATRPRIRRKEWVALTVLAAGATASLLALRERPARARDPLGSAVRVATYNLHYGFDEQWRYDPSRIAAALRDANVDIVALQEVTAAMPSAYGTDLGIYLARRLGMRVRFAPAINGLLGDAMLSRVQPDSFAARCYRRRTVIANPWRTCACSPAARPSTSSARTSASSPPSSAYKLNGYSVMSEPLPQPYCSAILMRWTEILSLLRSGRRAFRMHCESLARPRLRPGHPVRRASASTGSGSAACKPTRPTCATARHQTIASSRPRCACQPARRRIRPAAPRVNKQFPASFELCILRRCGPQPR